MSAAEELPPEPPEEERGPDSEEQAFYGFRELQHAFETDKIVPEKLVEARAARRTFRRRLCEMLGIPYPKD